MIKKLGTPLALCALLTASSGQTAVPDTPSYTTDQGLTESQRLQMDQERMRIEVVRQAVRQLSDIVTFLYENGMNHQMYTYLQNGAVLEKYDPRQHPDPFGSISASLQFDTEPRRLVYVSKQGDESFLVHEAYCAGDTTRHVFDSEGLHTVRVHSQTFNFKENKADGVSEVEAELEVDCVLKLQKLFTLSDDVLYPPPTPLRK